MQYEVPLYSRSIATETGTIYLIGGFIKQANIYLTKLIKILKYVVVESHRPIARRCDFKSQSKHFSSLRP